MDIMELGAIGELVGGVAVIGSLIFVGLQIRQHTHEQRLTASRELAALFNQTIAPILEDPRLTELWRVAVRDYESLEGDERLRIALLLDRHTRSYEPHFLHANFSRIDPSYLASARARFTEGFLFPGVQRWWEMNREGFSLPFRQHLDNLIANFDGQKEA